MQLPQIQADFLQPTRSQRTCKQSNPKQRVSGHTRTERGGLPSRCRRRGSSATRRARRRSSRASHYLLLPVTISPSLRRSHAPENPQAEDSLAEGLRPYEDEARRFSIMVPAAWEQRDKAGATALFASPERRGDTLGVVVNPVRVRSLRDFGDIDLVATRLLDAERRKTAIDAEMASWKFTGTYVDTVPHSGANIVDGMWIFRVKRPPGSPPVFKARYVARGFS
ncbi:unnamed protein product [Closterium sp. NIES-54]